MDFKSLLHFTFPQFARYSCQKTRVPSVCLGELCNELGGSMRCLCSRRATKWRSFGREREHGAEGDGGLVVEVALVESQSHRNA
jgi:hypothetical protein